MAYGLPADKLCEKLKKQDKQICELKYGTYNMIKFDIVIVINPLLVLCRSPNWHWKPWLEQIESKRVKENLESVGWEL